jgi:hypothetical protein
MQTRLIIASPIGRYLIVLLVSILIAVGLGILWFDSSYSDDVAGLNRNISKPRSANEEAKADMSGSISSNYNIRTPAAEVHKTQPNKSNVGAELNVHPLLLADGARKFVLDHIRDPSGDKRIYARRIAQECAMVRQVFGIDVVGVMPPTVEPNVASINNGTVDFFQRKCGQFSDVELVEILGIKFDSKSALMNLYNGNSSAYIGKKTEPIQRDSLIRELISSKNPVLFEDIGLNVLVNRDVGGSNGLYIYYDGTNYSVRDTEIGEALHLLPCFLGMDCSPTSYRYGLACLNAGNCDTIDFRANRLASRMAADVLSGNIKAFIRGT